MSFPRCSAGPAGSSAPSTAARSYTATTSSCSEAPRPRLARLGAAYAFGGMSPDPGWRALGPTLGGMSAGSEVLDAARRARRAAAELAILPRQAKDAGLLAMADAL